ncbi:DUF308 domain-containing protein [Saccharopolyspora pogona]|uniref:DUF308 domain-containing protein n=1 Tax=Saccharopolyspora pogona TaxID=333966 RepID=UPI0016880AF2|nr:DUF308 domain-containing protein [Saccharopolyspora pogona]
MTWGPGQQPRQEAQPERKAMSKRLWPISILADVAAVVALLMSSTQNVAVVIAAIALLLGVVHLWASFGKPVDRWVVLSVVGIVAGAAMIAVVATRSLLAVPDQASGQATDLPHQTSPTTPNPTTPRQPATTSASQTSSTSADPAVGRESGDKPIVLTSGYALDLDSAEPLWVAKRTEDSSGHDLENSSGYLYAREDIAVATAQATFEDCVRAGYYSSISSNYLVTGAAFCVKTTTGAYGRIVVRDAQGSKLVLDVVVWKKPS